MVRSLECPRGISTLTAFGLAVEIGDRHRFAGSTIGAYESKRSVVFDTLTTLPHTPAPQGKRLRT
ncbi:hypothetical protein ACOM2C_02260 [Pseudarthrobacter sp. So.54]